MIQPVIGGRNRAASDLTVSRSGDGSSLYVYHGLALIECVPNDPGAPVYRMLLGRLVNLGFGISALARLFGHDERTLRRWADALSSNDPDVMAAALSGRRACKKVTAVIERFVKMQYRLLRGLHRDFRRRILDQVHSVFAERISRERVRQLFRDADREDEERGRVADQATGCAPPSVPPSLTEPAEQTTVLPAPAALCPTATAAEPGNDNRSPVDAAQEQPRTLPWNGREVSGQLQAVHHAGLVLFCLWMDVFRWRRTEPAAMETQWLCQVLQDAVNLEQAGRVSVRDMARFCGEALPGIESQRRRLGQMADPEAVIDVYEANSRLIPDGPANGGEVFFYDPHSKECTGGPKFLKDWCGRRHGIAKVMHLDMIHTVSGFACFCQHYDGYYDLRERTFITLALFDRLFPVSRRSARTFVMDRGVFGSGTFGRFHARGDYILTWEKGYLRDAWCPGVPAQVFERFRRRNDPEDRRVYRFEMQSTVWAKDRRFRRIIVRATNPAGHRIEVSILCSNPTMSDERAVTLMFSRWLQENDFKYLDRHFGLMQITSYDCESYAEVQHTVRDRPVDCPEYRALKQLASDAEKELGKLLVADDHDRRRLDELQQAHAQLSLEKQQLIARIESILQILRCGTGPRFTRAMSESEPLPGQCRDLRRRIGHTDRQTAKVKQRIDRRQPEVLAARSRLDELDGQLDNALRKRSRLQLLIDGCYCRPDTRKKALFDALRITAAAMFRLLLLAFRPIYGNHRNDHVWLRQLTRADGFLLRRDGVIRIGLWLKGSYQTWQLTAFRTFLTEMARGINAQFAGRHAPIEIRVVRKPEQLYA